MNIKNLFRKAIVAKNTFPFDNKDLFNDIARNRSTLALVDNWIDDIAFRNSFFQYGVPDFIKSEINKDIDDSVTYSDTIAFLTKKYFQKVSYLEIGVSVGKNFFQILNNTKNGAFFGFDIEEINPVISNYFTIKDKVEWPSQNKSIKTNNSSLTNYDYKGKAVNYLSGDVWDENSWKALTGNRFNVIFSDALHSPEAILFEFDMLVKYQLLADNFIIIWDDLVGEMKTSFYSIIKKYTREYKLKEVFLLNMNGWVGQHESPHTVGIISNFQF